jgi:hypothetical protein
VLPWLIRLADTLGIDLASAAVDRNAINAGKYPLEKARINRKEYADLCGEGVIACRKCEVGWRWSIVAKSTENAGHLGQR